MLRAPPSRQQAPPPRLLSVLAPPRLVRDSSSLSLVPDPLLFLLHPLRPARMSASRSAGNAHKAPKQKALAGTVRALVLLMKSLACPTDPDDRLPVRGEALIRLWAIPFSTFVSNMRRDSRKNYDESRLAFSQALADLQRTIKAILSDRRVSAPKRLQQVARKLVRFLVHSFDFLKAAELTSAPLHHCNQA